MRRLDQFATPGLRLAAALALAAGMGAVPRSTAHAAPSPLRFDGASTAQLPPPTPTPGAGTEVTLLPGQETTVVPGFPPSPPVPIGYTRAAEPPPPRPA